MDWELRLDDAMSGPAARMAAALKPVEDRLRDVNRQLASSAIDKMNDGLEKQRAQLRLQRSDLAQNLRAARAQERAESQMDRAASRARAVAAREERLKARAAESQARVEQRARASADKYFQRSAQQRQRLDAQVRAREARALAASARQEQSAQRAAARMAAREQQRSLRQAQASQRASAREQQRAWSAGLREQSGALEGQRGEVRGMLPSQAGVLMAIAGAALAAAAAVAALGAAFSRAVVDAIAFREAAIGGLTQIMKDAAGARQVYQVGVSLAAKWNLDPRETVTQLQELVSKGFSAQDARVLLTASADLKVMNPNANIAGIMLAIGQIKSKGVLQMEELQGQLAEAGINVGKTLEILGKKLGKSSADVRKMISAGKIDSNTGIWAIVKSIEEMGGGKLGSVADKASKSISSMMAGLQFRPGLLGLKLAEMLEGGAGEGAVRNALQRLLKATDPEKSPGMKKLLASASGLANELLQLLFGPLSNKQGSSGMQQFLERAAVALQLVASAIRAVRPLVTAFFSGLLEGGREVFDVFAAVAKALGFQGDLSSAAGAARLFGRALAWVAGLALVVVSGLVAASATFLGFVAGLTSGFFSVVSLVGSTVAQILAFKDTMLSAGVNMGTNLWAGFVQGIESGIAAVLDAGTKLANAAKSAVGNALTIQSPSRVMMEMGAYTAEGFAQGVDGGAGQVDASMRDMVAPPAPVLGQGGSTTSTTLSAGGITVNVIIQKNDTGPDPKALGGAVGAEVVQALENLLAQMGLSPTPA